MKCNTRFVLERDAQGNIRVKMKTAPADAVVQTEAAAVPAETVAGPADEAAVQADAATDGSDVPKEAAVAGDGLHRSDIEILSGPSASAVKMSESRLWTVAPAADLSATNASLGLLLLIAKNDDERAGDPATTKSVIGSGLPLIKQNAPSWLFALFFLAAGLLFAAGHLSGYGFTVFFHDTVLVNGIDLVSALGMALGTMAGFKVLEAAAVGEHITATENTPLWGFSAGFLRTEPVAWRLGIPVQAALYTISLACSLIYAVFGWFLLSPPVMLGIATGASLYLIVALYPLEPGPGSKILETLTGSSDIPKQLQWTIISRFMALRLKADASSATAMSLAALFLACWAAFAAGTFYALTSDLFAQGSIAGVLWRAFFSLLGLLYTLWLLFRIVHMVSTASRLTGKATFTPVTPTEDVLAYLRHSSAINRHLPRLRDAYWQWASAPAGSFLIRRGADDNTFFWIASGKAAVFARDKNGDPLPVATLGPGTGVGEIALLENVRRTADVVVEQAVVVAILDQKTFMNYTEEEDRIRFRQVVMAGQALSRSRVFSGLAGSDREQWIAQGRPKTYSQGEIIIHEGSGEKWIALVVSGRMDVLRGGSLIADLGPDTVIGEMAYLEGKPRNATLRAKEETLLWQWDPEWLDSHLDKSGLLRSLTELARERGKA